MLFAISSQKIKTTAICMCLTILTITGYSQSGFKGIGIIGVNLSQLDGDTLYGFKRAGLTIGGKIYFQTAKKYNLTLEMLYSQRGSAPSLTKTNDPRSIKLNFIELPVTYMLHDWYIEKDNYYKVSIEGGLSYSYLFDKVAPYYVDNNFNQHELNYLLGATLRFNKKIGLGMRYTSSLGNIYKNPQVIENKLKSYFLTLRSEIYFN
jgi:hypothetical protein